MATEDVRTTALSAHVAKRELKDAIGTGVVVAVGVLRTTHAPNHSAGAIVGQRARNPLELRAGRARDALNFLWVPFRNFRFDLVHAVNTGADEFDILPTVFKDG